MVILFLLLLFVAVLLVNTARTSAKARKLEGQHPVFTEEELKNYGETFSRMLQCATVSVRTAMTTRSLPSCVPLWSKTSPCCTKRQST